MGKDSKVKPTLGIISDTSMYKDGIPYVFEPVLREVSAFSHLFKKIIWLGYNQGNSPPPNSQNITSTVINVTILPSSGGTDLFSKFRIILFIPVYILNIYRVIVNSDFIHTRGPSIPALLGLLLSIFFPRKKFWHKYAGNWSKTPIAFSYKLNRKLLHLNIPGIVFVSQKSELDSARIVQVPNPSFTLKELNENIKDGNLKQFDGRLSICYVGRFDKAKGVISILRALQNIKGCEFIDSFHFAGFTKENLPENILDGNSKVKIEFHGVLKRSFLDQIYRKCHFILLPSESEGFPKVLIEAASFGCIPIVPRISSILHHFNESQNRAIELKDNSVNSIKDSIENLASNRKNYLEISQKVMEYSRFFTYETYTQYIEKYIILSPKI
jgi:glycosyltransferase involved in cell wall biosynthesis